MSNQSSQEIAVLYKIGDNEIKLTPSIVQQYLVNGNAQITMPEFKMFTELCKVQSLNPFLKEAYCIKYGSSPATIVVGKDVIIKRAASHPQYDGKETGIIVQSQTGEIIERIGCFVAPNETLVGGWAKVHRKDWKYPEYMSVAVAEVAQKKSDGSYNSNWATKTATMVEKVAKVRALREAFVDELRGMFEAEEMGVELPTSVDFEVAPQEEPAETTTVSMDDL